MHVGPMSVCNVIDPVIYLDDEIVMLNLGEEMEGSVGEGGGERGGLCWLLTLVVHVYVKLHLIVRTVAILKCKAQDL